MANKSKNNPMSEETLTYKGKMEAFAWEKRKKTELTKESVLAVITDIDMFDIEMARARDPQDIQKIYRKEEEHLEQGKNRELYGQVLEELIKARGKRMEKFTETARQAPKLIDYTEKDLKRLEKDFREGCEKNPKYEEWPLAHKLSKALKQYRATESIGDLIKERQKKAV